MSNYIKQTKDGIEYDTVVRAPIRKVSAGMSFEEMTRAPITNGETKFKSDSILSQLDGKNRTFSNIEGMSLTMVARIHDNVFTDEVIIKGNRGNFYIVEIDGIKYSVVKSCVLFVTY